MPPRERVCATWCVLLLAVLWLGAASAGAERAAAGEDAAARPAPPAALEPASSRCRALRQQVARKEKVVRTHEGSVEANRRWADDIDRSAFSRRRYELRAEEEARWLARAQEDLDQFIEAQRRKGVPPDCLR